MAYLDVAINLLANDMASGTISNVVSQFGGMMATVNALGDSLGGTNRKFRELNGAVDLISPGLSAARRDVISADGALRTANQTLHDATQEWLRFKVDPAAAAAAAGMSVKDYSDTVQKEMNKARLAVSVAQDDMARALERQAGAADIARQSLMTYGSVAVASGLLFAGFAFAVKGGVESAGDLEANLVRLKIATQGSSDAMPTLTQAVNDLAIKTVYGSSEAANAFERMSEMGFGVSQILYGMGASADEYKQHAYDATEATKGLGMQGLILGQAMKTDAVQGAELLGAALNTFRDQGLEATDAANLLAGAYFNGVPSAEALQQAIAMTGAQASTAGIPLKDMLTTLDLLTQSGMSASSAGASLNYMIQSMIAPTQKQAKELADLGIMTVNTGTAYDTFREKLLKVGAVSEDQLKLWDGSVTGLHNMYEAAQQAGLIPLDQNFNEWALKAGVLKNNLFDASGKFVGMKDAIKILDEAMKGMSVEEKMNALGELFNVRSGRAARILTDIDEFSTRYDDIFKKIGKTDVTKAADDQLKTLQGSLDALKDSAVSALAMAFLPFIGVLADLVTNVNNLLQGFINLPPQIQGVIGIFLIAGLVAAGLSLAIFGVAFAMGLLALAGIPLAAVLIPIGVVIGAIAVVAGLVAGGYLLMTTYGKQLHDAMQSLWEKLEPIRQILGNILSPLEGIKQGIMQLGDYLKNTFERTWKDIKKDFEDFWHTIQDNLKPAFDDMKRDWHQLKDALRDAQPGIDLVITGFKWLAIIVGISVVMSLGLLLAVLVGLSKAFVGLVGGIVMMVNGIIEIVSGIFEFFTGFWGGLLNVLDDLVHGRTEKIVQDTLNSWEHMKHGLKSIGEGIVTLIFGFFYGLAMGIWGLVSGFVGTVISWFQHLFDVLVGHSIVPDLINAIISWFASLPQKARDALGSLIGKVGGVFNDLASNGWTWIHHFSDNIINGLWDLVGRAGNAAHAVADAIAHWLGHTKPAGGPMADDDVWMVHFMDNMVGGIDQGLPALHAKAREAAAGIKGAFSMDGTFTPGMSSMQINYAMQNSQRERLQPVQVFIGDEKVYDAVLDHATGQLKMSGVNRYGR